MKNIDKSLGRVNKALIEDSKAVKSWRVNLLFLVKTIIIV
jgi:hypothetical protein